MSPRTWANNDPWKSQTTTRTFKGSNSTPFINLSFYRSVNLRCKQVTQENMHVFMVAIITTRLKPPLIFFSFKRELLKHIIHIKQIKFFNTLSLYYYWLYSTLLRYSQMKKKILINITIFGQLYCFNFNFNIQYI